MKSYQFIPGLELNRNFYSEIIKPLIDDGFPELKYSAALIGYGSDVLGFDNATSTDHNWGPRCQIFLDQVSLDLREPLIDYFKWNLPLEYCGFPTNFTDPRIDFTQKMSATSNYPVNHLIEVYSLEIFFNASLDLDNINEISEHDWLRLNDQTLLELTSGEVFHDGLNQLITLRKKIAFYPEPVYRLRMASLWMMVANEETFVGRCIEINDFIGAKLIVSRIASTLFKILFYLERQYIPYSKWFGSRLRTLVGFTRIELIAEALLTSNDLIEMNANLISLYEVIIKIHNRTSDLPKLNNQIKDFYGRPYDVINAENISNTLIDSIDLPNKKDIRLEKIALDLKIESVDFTE